MEDKVRRSRRLIGIALSGLIVAAGSLLSVELAVADNPQPTVFVFNVPVEFHRLNAGPCQAQPAQTGEIKRAGPMNSVFVTDHDTDTYLSLDSAHFAELPGVQLFRHVDKYQSTTYTHVDSEGKTRPDSYSVEYTIVLMIPNPEINPPLKSRVTFAGSMFDGTGIYEGATGVLNGYAYEVTPPDGGVAFSFKGRQGGEVHFAPGALR